MTTAHSTQHPDALDILEADHRTVEQLFDAFSRAEANDLERKTTLVQRTCELLSIHSIVEEELLLFYPVARTALGKDHRIDVDEAFVEHYLVKTLIEKFSQLKAGETGFDETFKVLKENVTHHVEEEKSELFPEIRRAGVDLAAPGKKIEARKQTLQGRITEAATAH